MKSIIAIDFDETITDNTPYPITGKIRNEARVYIQKLYEAGYQLVLWTCRQDNYLQEALELLEDEHLLQFFSYYNDDGLERKSRKIDADFYVDDKSCIGEIDWNTIYNYIIKTIPIEREIKN